MGGAPEAPGFGIRPDFVLGTTYSQGQSWTVAELQSPRSAFFTKKRRPTEHLDEGLRQILEWRRWLAANRDYARRSRVEQGLGLTGIDDKAHGLLLIGRERTMSVADAEQLRQLAHDHRVDIHTYDWLVREARNRLNALKSSHRVPRPDTSS